MSFVIRFSQLVLVHNLLDNGAVSGKPQLILYVSTQCISEVVQVGDRVRCWEAKMFLKPSSVGFRVRSVVIVLRFATEQHDGKQSKEHRQNFLHH